MSSRHTTITASYLIAILVSTVKLKILIKNLSCNYYHSLLKCYLSIRRLQPIQYLNISYEELTGITKYDLQNVCSKYIDILI